MPRIARGAVPGHVYHVLNRGNGRREIFHKDGDYQGFLDLMARAKEKHPFKIFAYCLMPNHFHFVLEPQQDDSMSKFMQWLLTSHVRRYHSHYETCGHIWQGRYKSFLIKADSHLLTVLRYVEANPVRAGLAVAARDWPWSSIAGRLDPAQENLVADSPVELPPDWGEYVNEVQSAQELREIRTSVNRQSPFGDDMWQWETARTMGLLSTLNPRGRPIKMGK